MNLLEYHFEAKGPGAALGVIVGDTAPIVACRGLADIDRGEPITPDTVFDLASASKLFTSTAIMRLVERERVDLTSPVRDFLPGLGLSDTPRQITIRDLLWHTSGLVDYLESGMYTPPEHRTRDYVLEQLPSWAHDAIPGTMHGYSNTNYVVLARVIEAISGVPFETFVDEQLLQPFGLTSTYLLTTEGSAASVATGYLNVGTGLADFAPCEAVLLDTDGDGGVHSTLNDLIRWFSALQRGEIVRAASLRLMQTPGYLDAGDRFPYGMGLQVETQDDDPAWWGHGGSWTHSTVLLGCYARDEITVIVLSNEFMAPVERISQRAFAQIAASR